MIELMIIAFIFTVSILVIGIVYSNKAIFVLSFGLMIILMGLAILIPNTTDNNIVIYEGIRYKKLSINESKEIDIKTLQDKIKSLQEEK